MASLKEIKSRIASVNSTLKITSAMKMVASAKLHRVQSKAEALAGYEHRLSQIASGLLGSGEDAIAAFPLSMPHKTMRNAVIVAFSSDGSLCGSFNANAIRVMEQQMKTLLEEGAERVTVYPVGEKIAQAAHKLGYETCDDFRHLAGAPSYDRAAELAGRMMELYTSGAADRVCLVYSHFHSMSKHEPRSEVYLPLNPADMRADSGADGNTDTDYIYEPEAAQLLREILPYTLRIRLYKTLLDNGISEHSARMVAMQTATDNARELLDELSLDYNKRRQQAITDELADIAGTN